VNTVHDVCDMSCALQFARECCVTTCGAMLVCWKANCAQMWRHMLYCTYIQYTTVPLAKDRLDIALVKGRAWVDKLRTFNTVQYSTLFSAVCRIQCRVFVGFMLEKIALLNNWRHHELGQRYCSAPMV